MSILWQVQVASVFIGAVLGAGFASGQEILQFFVRYGRDGLEAVIIAGILFGLVGPSVLYVCCQKSIFQYQDLLHHLFGRRWGRIMDVIIGSSLFAGAVVMLSGTGALVSQQWGWSNWVGVLGTAGLVLLALWRGIGGLVWVNTFLVPLKSAICLAVGAAVVFWAPGIETIQEARQLDIACFSGWSNPQAESASSYGVSLLPTSPTLAAFLYVSFNLVMSVVVLVALTPQVKIKGGYFGAAVGGVLLGLFAYVLSLAMLKYSSGIESYPVPMLFLAGALHPWTGKIYAFLLWLAMFTAALGSVFGAALRLSRQEKGKKYHLALLFSVLLAVPFALLSFAELVATLYPVFGYVGIPLIVGIGWTVGRELLVRHGAS